MSASPSAQQTYNNGFNATLFALKPTYAVQQSYSSMTSSRRASVGEFQRPSAFAVFKYEPDRLVRKLFRKVSWLRPVENSINKRSGTGGRSLHSFRS